MKIPRVRTRIGVASQPPEVVGKFFVEISIGSIDGKDMTQFPEHLGPFDTMAEAEKASEKIAKDICDAISIAATGETADYYINMKDMSEYDFGKEIH